MFPQSIRNIYHALSATLATIYYKYPAKSLKVIGVTGTDGKTTTSSIIYHILKESGKKVALISTVAAYIGDKTIDTGFHTTTPNEWRLQKLLAEIKNENIEFVVLEATSIGLDQHRLLGTNIRYAVFTNITHEHLDYHKSLNNYVLAKIKLLKNAKKVILNQDNSTKSLSSYVANNKNIVMYSQKQLNESHPIRKLFPSTHNQENAHAAMTLVRELGIPDEQITKSMESFKGIPGRLEYVENDIGINIVVDFAHTPNALQKTLIHLKEITKGKLVTVFGATGRRDITKRPIMGKFASLIADEVVLTSDDTYGENIDTIIRQIKEGVVKNHGHIHSIPDRGEAIQFALNTLCKSGDTLAVLGQGHEQSINLDGVTEIPWNDTKIIKAYLKGN